MAEQTIFWASNLTYFKSKWATIYMLKTIKEDNNIPMSDGRTLGQQFFYPYTDFSHLISSDLIIILISIGMTRIEYQFLNLLLLP